MYDKLKGILCTFTIWKMYETFSLLVDSFIRKFELFTVNVVKGKNAVFDTGLVHWLREKRLLVPNLLVNR